MTHDFIEYPKLMERAVRGVVREALALVAERGLPGMHHFYITFRTTAPGVSIPDNLVQQYPDEMTIVIEHQFWDLEVGEDAFTVTLSFKGATARLGIPFEAITGFVDPSVKFGLQFGTAEPGTAAAPVPGAPEPEPAPPDEPAPDERVVALDQFRKK